MIAYLVCLRLPTAGRQVLGRISKGSEDAEVRLQKAFQHPPATKARRQAYFCWTIQVDKAKTSSFYAGKIG